MNLFTTVYRACSRNQICIEMFMIVHLTRCFQLVHLTRCFQLVHLYEDNKSCCEVNVKMLGLSDLSLLFFPFFFFSPLSKDLFGSDHFCLVFFRIMCFIVFM